MDLILHFVDLFLHLDRHLAEVIVQFGFWTYLILFLIIFCETGLVVTPILPGDSLLFAAGALCATTPLDVVALGPLLIVAAILGDAVNYMVGKFLGARLLKENHRFLKKEYLEKTQKFYYRYGGKTIILARFVPIVRTFAPFMAGVGVMTYRRFAIYNVVGAVLWIGIFLYGGYFFGNIPAVKSNFTLVILGIIFVSVLPGIIEYIRSRKGGAPTVSV